MWCEIGADLYVPEWARCCNCPTRIEVLRLPYKTSYEIGETMDYTGLIVRAYTAKSIWENKPAGIIPIKDLIFPVTEYNGETEIPVQYNCTGSLLSTSFSLRDCPSEIRLTTMPKTVYEVDPEHQFPLPVDFTEGVVQAYKGDGTLWNGYPNGIIPHSEITLIPSEITGGSEDPGAYYLFTGLDNWQVVNTQSDNTGGAVSGDVGARFCAIMVGTDQYIYGVGKTPFTMKSATWDGTGELYTYSSSAYVYGGETYYVAVTSSWHSPPPVSTISYNVRNDQPVNEQAIDICYGGHPVADETIITVSWESPCGEELTTSYEVFVH